MSSKGDRKPGSYLGSRVGLTTLGQPRLSEGAQPYPRQNTVEQGETGNRMIGCEHNFRSQVSAIRSRVRVVRFRFG